MNLDPITYSQVRRLQAPVRLSKQAFCLKLQDTNPASSVLILGFLVVQGEETRQQMNAELYLECSAKYQEYVEDIFREATKTALAFNRKQKKRKRKICSIL